MESFQFYVLAACVACTIGVSLNSRFDDEWKSWKTTHKKTYDDEREDTKRRLIWQENLEFIVKHNLEHQRGLHSYSLGMNAFGDMKHEEFHAFYSGLNAGGKNLNKTGKPFISQSNISLPDSVDWREKGYVTPVKDQELCGSCWSFSATGALEGQHFNKTGKLVSLSEQNLVDCNRDNDGCKGGLYSLAFDYVKDAGGIDTEEGYPYTGVDSECRFNRSRIGATCSGHVDLYMADERTLQEAVATVGPISVAIDAQHISLQFYYSGVYDEPACEQFKCSHAMLVVGYGATDVGDDYWLVKNSWSPFWGQKGYIWMSRNKNNQCGIASAASYPLV